MKKEAELFCLTKIEEKQLGELESGINNIYFREYFLAKTAFLNDVDKNLLNSSKECLELLKQIFGEQASPFEGKSGLCFQWNFKAENGDILSVTHTQRGIDFGIINNEPTENLFESAYCGRTLIAFSEYIYFKMSNITKKR